MSEEDDNALKSDADSIKARRDFLLKMYETLNKEIDRHINSIWQVIGVLISSLIVFVLVEKQVISLDYAITFIAIVLGLAVAYVLEANYWYNRNLVIIANIERQFLLVKDQKDIHYYFARHRGRNELLAMMQIQLTFLAVFASFIFIIHFKKRVLEGLSAPFGNFEFDRAFPYIILIAALIVLYKFYNHRIQSYLDFRKNSPGVEMPIYKGIDLNSSGHPVDPNEIE